MSFADGPDYGGKWSIGGGRSFPPALDREVYLVDFEGPDDPLKAQNWPSTTKLVSSVLACSGTFIASLNSAMFSPGIDKASREFGVGREVITLGTTLFVLGFATGPMIWAPMSELLGRRLPLLIAIFGEGIFTIACAVAKDVQTLIICRFFAGVCGACQLTVVPGLLADLYDNTYRGVAIAVYALTVFGGPFVAPITGGFTASSYLGWRWTLYIPAFLAFAISLLSLFWLKEPYAPSILTEKARLLRKESGNWGIHSKQEEVDLDIGNLIEKYLTRPLRLLVTEPVLLLISLYMSFIYGLVYALLVAYPYVFEHTYGMRPGIAGLPFIGLIVGVLFGLGFILSQQRRYTEKLAANNNIPVPEWRLLPTMIGAPMFTIGLFWFGWTGFTSQIHWAAPAVAGIFIGFGVLCIFLPCFNYLVDAYLSVAASAVAANIILRSAFASSFPLFTRQMFANLGVQWACALLGCVAAVLVPIPFLFWSDWGYECHYGHQPTSSSQPPSLAPTAAALDAAPATDTTPKNERQHGENVRRRLEANSGTSSVRNIGIKVDAVDAPNMNLFGWNVGCRQLSSHPNPVATPALSIFEITSPEEIKNLAQVYFDKVDPCYAFVNRQLLFQRLDERSQSTLSDDRYDSVFAGVAALGSLFSRKDVTLTEVHLVQSARSKLEVDMQARPSFDLVTGWILRVIYMRMTALPYPTWLASCTLMHLIEASGACHELSTSAQNSGNDHDLKANLVGIAQHLNLWISFDLGLSRVPCLNDNSLPPIKGTNDILSLLPASVSLDPEQATHDKSLESSLLQLLDKHYTEPPSILAQCNLVLCMLRRLNSTTHNFGPAIIDRILILLQRGLRAARTLLKACSPWHHIANVPFHTVTCLLLLDMRASLKLLAEAMHTLRLVASVYTTDTMTNACRTAELLILLYQRRRRDDIKLLDDVIGTHEEGRTEEPVQQLWPDPDQFSWVENLVVGIPSLEGIEFDQLFSQGDGLSIDGSEFIPPIPPM
ncbi:major facilitator superfamily domain-containing protein [Aspergillus californicus]